MTFSLQVELNGYKIELTNEGHPEISLLALTQFEDAILEEREKCKKLAGSIYSPESIEQNDNIAMTLAYKDRIYFPLEADNLIQNLTSEKAESLSYGYLKTAVLVFVYSLTIFILVNGSVFSLIPLFFCFTSGTMSYMSDCPKFLLPQSIYGYQQGTLLVPHPNSNWGKITRTFLIWPLILGVFLPIINAITLIPRLRSIIENERNRICSDFHQSCAIYKKYAQIIYDHILLEKGTATKHPSDYDLSIEILNNHLDYFRKYDPEMPPAFPKLGIPSEIN